MADYKIYSWNVNGIRAVQRKGFVDWLETEKPDILGLQETKAWPEQLDAELTKRDDYSIFYSSAEKKGYSGTGLFSKTEPVHVSYTLSDDQFNSEGRIISADYQDFVLFNIYFPNGKASPERLKFKMGFYQAFSKDVAALLKKGREVIVCGDVNTAHTEIDLARPKQNVKISGFLPEERAWIDSFLNLGFIDSFRHLHPEPDNYTWWSQRGGARERNVGWRIDYFYISKGLEKSLKAATHHTDVMGSDHCPISITLSI